MTVGYRFSSALLILARCLLVALALASSLLSIGLFMAGIGDNNLPLVTQMWILYFLSALVIGACIPRRWYCAIAVAWLPLLLLPEVLLSALFGQTVQQSAANQLAVVMLMLSPLVALTAGYVGSKITRACLVALGG